MVPEIGRRISIPPAVLLYEVQYSTVQHSTSALPGRAGISAGRYRRRY